MSGRVYFIGAGPGDPELLTRKACRLLQAADVILHDDLVPPDILALASPHAEIFNVGKRCGRSRITQQEINFLTVSSAQSGFMVVRLKGGDPQVFGRLGEEIEALREADIDFEIVPGITAACAAAAAAGIPLTDRQLASELVFLAGHCASGRSPGHGWGRLSASATVVVYMPGSRYEQLAEQLCQAGLGPDTPCLIVASASRPEERRYLTTIEHLPQSPINAAPSVLIVGAVAALGRPSAHELEEVMCGAAGDGETISKQQA